MSSSAFTNAYHSILTSLRDFDLPVGLESEVSAYLYYITVACAGNNSSEFLPYAANDFVQSRYVFYCTLRREDIRAMWLLSAPSDSLMSTDIGLSFLAFGDLITNRESRRNYAGAHQVITGFDSSIKFQLAMMHLVLPQIVSYVRTITSSIEKQLSGHALSADSIIVNSGNQNPRADDPNTYSNAGIYFGIVVAVVFALILFATGFFSDRSPSSSGSGSSRSAAVYTATQKPRATATPKPRATATPKPKAPAKTYKPSYADDIAGYYQRNYPATWGYIKKNSSNPYLYVKIYDGIWGALQAYHRDGIPFSTLTKYEMSLIYYPNIGSRIYFSDANSRTYHSTLNCYTLLKSSSPVYRSSSTRYQYEPCSKCVGE